MFCVLGFTDDKILYALKQEGYQIEKTLLVQICYKQQLWQQLSVFNQAGLEEQLQEAIKEELDKGLIKGYSQGLLYTYFYIIRFIATWFEVISYLYN